MRFRIRRLGWLLVSFLVIASWSGSAAPKQPITLVNNSVAFVSHTIPSSMYAGRFADIQITVQNTGDATWTNEGGYRIAAAVGNDPFTGGNRISIPSGLSVAPGQQFTFTARFTAPSAPGSYTSAWRMVEELIEFFGPTLSVPVEVVPLPNAGEPDASVILSSDFPDFVQQGEVFPVSITVRNTGTNTWSSDLYDLRALVNPCSIFPQRIELQQGVNVLPGAAYTFNLTVAAPGTAIFSDSFETDQGWQATGLWHKTDEASGRIQSKSPTHSWWYGSEETGDYDVPLGVANNGELLSPPISINPGAKPRLSFDSLESTEYLAGFDRRRLYVDLDGVRALIYEGDKDKSGWESVGPIDLSAYAGQTIRLVFSFDTIDELSNGFQGWAVDNLLIDGAVCDARFQMTQEFFGQPFGEPLDVTLTVGDSLVEDFSAGGGDSQNWLSGVLSGSGNTFVGPSGLCMSVPAAGDNITLWITPDRSVELRENTLYRIVTNLTTDQTLPDRIPLFQVLFDNFNANGTGNVYGGSCWFLDNVGGANGIGRAQGRSQFTVFFAPNAAITPQWNGNAGDGTSGIFTPAADASNDFRIAFRLLDLGSSGFGASLDSGTVCVNSMRVDAIPLSQIGFSGTIYNTPISTDTYAPFAYGQSPFTAFIDNQNNKAVYALSPDSDLATLLPAVGTQPYTADRLYPILWQSNTLYRVRASIQLAADSTGLDPLDAMDVTIDTVTNELGQTNWTTRGASETPFFKAASPRSEALIGSAQTYATFFYTQNATLSSIPNGNRWRPLVYFRNSPNLFGTGTGTDTVEVVAVTVDEVILPFLP